MFIRKLYVQNFRNLREQEISFSSNLNILIGENGHGKTNLIEAIYILSTTKSFRTSKKEELIQWGKDRATIFVEIERDNSVATLSIEITKNKTKFYKNGEQIKRDLRTLTTVSFFPSDLEVIKGGPSERRRLIDKLIVDLYPESLKTYLVYQRALVQKNKILRSEIPKIEQLKVYNDILIKAGQIISEQRRSIAKLLTEAATKKLHFLKTPEQHLEVSYKPSAFKEENITREISAKTSLFGAHRDDFEFKLEEREARAYASQGQSRSILLAIKLASIDLIEEKRKTSPVVLLDDVDSELDEKRRGDFFEYISSSNRQVIISGPGGRHLEDLPGKLFRISDGHWIKP